MIKVIMMCGICGSGKTTYAKQKEKEGYVRLSIDEEMWKTYGRKGIDYPNEQYEKLSEIVEMALQKELLSLIQQGKHVVLDFSFWNKANRAYYKRLVLYTSATLNNNNVGFPYRYIEVGNIEVGYSYAVEDINHPYLYKTDIGIQKMSFGDVISTLVP